MAFFDQLGKKLTETGQSAIQKTKDLAGIAKFKSMISDEEARINAAYLQIGKLYFEKYASSDTDEYFIEAITAIKNAQATIVQHSESIRKIKGVTNCPVCGAEVPYTASFCNSCGGRIVVAASAPKATEIANICTSCGASLEVNQRFCTSCGTPTANVSDVSEIHQGDAMIESSQESDVSVIIEGNE